MQTITCELCDRIVHPNDTARTTMLVTGEWVHRSCVEAARAQGEPVVLDGDDASVASLEGPADG